MATVSDMNVALVVSLMDKFSGPARNVQRRLTSIKRSTAKFRADLGAAFKKDFSADSLDAALGRAEQRIGQRRGKLMAASAALAIAGAPVILAGNTEEELIHFANLAEINQDRVKQLRGELNELRRSTGMSGSALLSGLETYVGKGMALDEALKAMGSTGRAAKAYRSEFEIMANSGFSSMDNLKVAPEELGKAFDIMAMAGKEGSFELAAMAANFPVLTAGAKALKMEGTDAVGSIAAALQIAMKSAGSEDQAANNMANFLGKLTSPDTVKNFKKMGVNIEKEMEIAAKAGLRFIPVIGWALLAADLGMFVWDHVIKPLGWDEYISDEHLASTLGKLAPGFDWGNIIKTVQWTALLPATSLKNAWLLLNGRITWQEIIDDIPWDYWFSFNWSNVTPDWKWSDIAEVINWTIFLPQISFVNAWKLLSGQTSSTTYPG